MELALFVLAGFVAQLVDGALGMAYGVTCTSLLLSFGFTPAAASASVHTAELITSGVSGHFHLKLGNVDQALFKRLVWPGMAGAILGAALLVRIPADAIRPWVAAYLAAMGVRILLRARHASPARVHTRSMHWLGLGGGFLDAIGGGGWGPVVTSTLIGQGQDPRRTIGSVNRAEFFVTLAQTAVFISSIGITHWRIVMALCAGGALAAPLAARVTKRASVEHLMTLVGAAILLLSLRTLWLAL